MMWLRASILIIVIIVVAQRSFVDTAPLHGPALVEDNRKVVAVPKKDEVMQLEDLKQRQVGEVKVESQENPADGLHVTPVPVQSAQVDLENGKMIDAGPQVGLEPGSGSGTGQEELMIENLERRSERPDLSNQLDSMSATITSPGVQYSPRDMAEYVFWTGDEKGVTLAIEEFLDDQLLTREEAISFLQEIKINLDYLQLHYSQKQRFHKAPRDDLNDMNALTEQAKEKVNAISKSFNTNDHHDHQESPTNKNNKNSNNNEKREGDKSVKEKRNGIENNSPMMQTRKALDIAILNQVDPDQLMTGTMSDNDYDEIIERLKVADFLYTEYSLEEVIYQLAKVMFSQSLTKGSTEAHEALRKFTNFLAGEAERGRISSSLEKKVLDVLIASLTDTLSEHPQLLPPAHLEDGSHTSANDVLEQLLMLNTATRPASLPARPHQSTLAKARELNKETGKKTEIENTPVKSN